MLEQPQAVQQGQVYMIDVLPRLSLGLISTELIALSSTSSIVVSYVASPQTERRLKPYAWTHSVAQQLRASSEYIAQVEQTTS